MYVGIQGFKNVAGQEEIFGDDLGQSQSRARRRATASTASATTRSGLKSIALAFAPVATTAAGQTPDRASPAIIAGIPQDKSNRAPARSTASPSRNTTGNGLLPYSFGQPSPTGATWPSTRRRAHPDFEFTINNFSKIAGINPANGFYIAGVRRHAGR